MCTRVALRRVEPHSVASRRVAMRRVVSRCAHIASHIVTCLASFWLQIWHHFGIVLRRVSWSLWVPWSRHPASQLLAQMVLPDI